MTGLTWGDDMRVTGWQAAALMGNAALFGVWGLCGWSTLCPIIYPALVGFLLCQAVFWRDLVVLDSFLLLRECAELEGKSWSRFSKNYLKHPYLEYQTPFVPFLIARCSGSQVTIWLCSALCGAVTVTLLSAHYGANAAFLLACPLVMLLLVQPSTDLPMLTGVILTFIILDTKLYILAAVIFACSVMIKPIALCLYPFLLLTSPAFIASAFIWFLAWNEWRDHGWVKHHIDFLLHQCYLVCLPSVCKIGAEARQKTGKPPLSWARWVWKTFLWRWKQISFPALLVLPVYVFPVFAGYPGFQLPGAVLAGAILLLYGNVKYYIFALLLLF